MLAFVAELSWALWLGVLTSLSPCPLATNIAAMSYVGRRVGSARQVLGAGLLYTLGRTLTYVVLGLILVAGISATSRLSMTLQELMSQLLGPGLILVAMFLLGLFRPRISSPPLSERLQRHVAAWGTWSALWLGVVFALSFCPVSAALFFGSLIPLSLRTDSCAVLPALYGLGTALPVLAFAVMIAFGAQSLGKTHRSLLHAEWWAQRGTGLIFLAIGLHFSLKYCLEITPIWQSWLDAVRELI